MYFLNFVQNPSYSAIFFSRIQREIFSIWLEYKKEKGNKYKSKSTAMICYKNLIELSNNNIDSAKKIIEQSMANNWSGLFELKGGNNGKYGSGKSKLDSSINAAREYLENNGIRLND